MRIHGTVIVGGRIGPFSIDTRRVSNLLVEALKADPALAVLVGDTLVAGKATVAELATLPVGYGISITLELADADLAAASGTPALIAEAEATSKAADEAGA